MEANTIIVGGGMAGMSCALELLEANRAFMLITESLGGRILYSEKTGVNYGAYFVMQNYTHARQLLAQETLLLPTDACFHNSETERFGLLNPHTLRRLPELLRFYFVMREFSAHYEPYKQRCLVMPQKAALEADPYMARLFSLPASRLIQEKKIENVASDYVSKFTYACTGVSPKQLTALDFLNVGQGMVTPIHRFSFDRQAMSGKLGERLVFDGIVRLERQDGGYLLSGKSGQAYRAGKVVLATPATVTQQLLGLAEIRQACKLYVFHVKAQLKPIYAGYAMNLFPYTSEIMLTAKQFDGTFLIYAREKQADLHQVCAQFELLETVDWEQAMYVEGPAYMEQQYGAGLYVAGDHNGLGLEPAAISGIYAANQVIGGGAKP
jgi:glycine/D-amino acid oxidase-like deaminating enzyme